MFMDLLLGEGISQAVRTVGPPRRRYLVDWGARILAANTPYHRIAAAVRAELLGRPRVTAAVARLLSAAGGGDSLGGGWALFWYELLDDALLNKHRSVANASPKSAE
jgi:hypothetical protein